MEKLEIEMRENKKHSSSFQKCKDQDRRPQSLWLELDPKTRRTQIVE